MTGRRSCIHSSEGGKETKMAKEATGGKKKAGFLIRLACFALLTVLMLAFATYVLEVESRLGAHQPMNRANRMLPIFLLVGLLIGVMVALAFKSQMKTVRRKSGAMSYVRDGSFHLSRQQDIYLYTTTVRRRIEMDSGRGSGGGSHGSFTGGSGTHHTSSSYKM